MDIDLINYGVVGDGSDESPLIQQALDAVAAAGGGVVMAGEAEYGIGSTITIPAKVCLQLAPNAELKPLANVVVVKQKPGSWFIGRIDTSACPGWNAVALDFDGDHYSQAIPFLLETNTYFDVELFGSIGGANGTAIKMHADNAANARVQGVMGKARVYGFDDALWLRQTSVDGTKYVNGNVIEIDGAYSRRALRMDSSHASGYHIDGNHLRIQFQPRPGTTVPAFSICGQQNSFNLTPWDWDALGSSPPYAISIQANARRNRIDTVVDPAFIEYVAPVNGSNIVNNPFAGGGLRVHEIASASGDGVVRLLGSSLRLANSKSILAQTADGLNEYAILTTDANNNTYLQAPNTGAASIIHDSRGSGSHIFKTRNGHTQFAVIDNGQAVNHLRAYGAPAGGSPAIGAAGADANISLALVPKGTGNVVASANINVTTAGKGLRVKEGADAKQGVVTLVAGSATVANGSVTANSRILLTGQTDGGSPGWLRVSGRTPGQDFTITSSSDADTSTVAYEIFEPA